MTSKRVDAPIRIREGRPLDRPEIRRILFREWGAPGVVSRGRLHPAHEYPAKLAVRGRRIVGLLTYRIDRRRCEVVTLNSFLEGRGIGTKLLAAATRTARSAGCREIWLVTTNDNLRAIGFYQRRAFFLRRVHARALEGSRRLKPSIPKMGMNGIPLRDEVELWKPLNPGPEAS